MALLSALIPEERGDREGTDEADSAADVRLVAATVPLVVLLDAEETATLEREAPTPSDDGVVVTGPVEDTAVELGIGVLA